MQHLIEVILKEPALQDLLGGLLAWLVTSEALPFIKRWGGNGVIHALALAFQKADNEGPPPPSGSSARAILPLLLIPLLSGCYCMKPDHKAEPKCVLQAAVIECAETNLTSVLPFVAGIVMNLISGQPVDPSALIAQLEGAGFKDGACILAALEDYVRHLSASKASEQDTRAAVVHDALRLWLEKHGVHGQVTVKLSAAKRLGVVAR